MDEFLIRGVGACVKSKGGRHRGALSRRCQEWLSRNVLKLITKTRGFNLMALLPWLKYLIKAAWPARPAPETAPAATLLHFVFPSIYLSSCVHRLNVQFLDYSRSSGWLERKYRGTACSRTRVIRKRTRKCRFFLVEKEIRRRSLFAMLDTEQLYRTLDVRDKNIHALLPKLRKNAIIPTSNYESINLIITKRQRSNDNTELSK